MRSTSLARAASGVLLLAAVVFAGPAHAARWLRAESAHFIVHTSSDERTLRDYVSDLEDFDDLLRRVHGQPLDAPPGRKLDLYLVSGPGEMNLVRPGAPPGLRGFYSAGLGDIFAIGIRTAGDSEDDVVLHEYVHHFMRQNYPAAYPAWLTEGYAEYFMTAKLEPTVREVGRFNPGRANALLLQPWIPLRDLMNKRMDASGLQRGNVYYAQAWLLTHYTLSDPERRRKLGAYVAAVGQGAAPLAAWTATYGDDEKALEGKLRIYAKNSLAGRDYPRPGPPTVAMTVTPEPPSADELMLLGQRVKLGVAPADRAALAARIRAAAARYPDDRFAQLTLAQMEVSIGDQAAGRKLLDTMLATDPNDLPALRLAAYSRVRQVEADPQHGSTAVAEGSALLARAYRIEPDDYQVLYNYARIRAGQPDYPTENAINALLRAVELAPQVDPVRLQAGEALLARGRAAEAVDILTPVANNPHGGALATRAQALIARVRGQAS
ncbi:MAG: hypothetical protein JWP92_434 [Caulobacter sp.]|nr:hypothetical protein [Caulobacter sp.]